MRKTGLRDYMTDRLFNDEGTSQAKVRVVRCLECQKLLSRLVGFIAY